jgi:hypothetical protein
VLSICTATPSRAKTEAQNSKTKHDQLLVFTEIEIH